MKVELGKTIVALRARVESYSQWDRAQAEKAFSGSDMEGETNTQPREAVGNQTLQRNSTGTRTIVFSKIDDMMI